MTRHCWTTDVLRYVRQLRSATGLCPYFNGGHPTLYGEVYSCLTLYYLTGELPDDFKVDRILEWQDSNTGLFVGPELREWDIPGDASQDREHLELHLTISVLPLLAISGCSPNYPIQYAHQFLSETVLQEWLSRRKWELAWNEGNKLLFVLQLLVHLRDVEKLAEANDRIRQVFDWLATEIDSKTGLWGTQHGCRTSLAMFGAYHQLLAYYFEKEPVLYPERLIDSTLNCQAFDGLFSPVGGGGACEDADGVDILVNLYKRCSYRQPHVRISLKRALHGLLNLQNEDGGFPYNRIVEFSHMKIPATMCGAGASNIFSTWFRVHTILLIGQVIRDSRIPDRACFNSTLSMGWNDGNPCEYGLAAQIEEWRSVVFRAQRFVRFPRVWLRRKLKPAILGALSKRSET